jgi:hypothetical protein
MKRRIHNERIWKLCAVCYVSQVYSFLYYIFVKRGKHYVAHRIAEFVVKKKVSEPFFLS